MAEPKPEDKATWWGGWLQSAKEKSTNALEFMKHDLAELSQVVQEDTASAVTSTANLLKDKLHLDDPDSLVNQAKFGLSTFVTTLTDAFSPTRETDETELLVIHNSEPILLDRWQAEVHKIQVSKETYSHEPQTPPDKYESWLEDFDLEIHRDEMANILMSCPEVSTFYNQLVPHSVAHLEFWQRYFYRIEQLRKAEIRRAEIIKRADVEKEEPLSWDNDEEDDIAETNPPLTPDGDARKLIVKDKGDLVVVSEKESSSSLSTDTPEGSTGDDWEKDFEMELNEDDLTKVEHIQKEISNNDQTILFKEEEKCD